MMCIMIGSEYKFVGSEYRWFTTQVRWFRIQVCSDRLNKTQYSSDKTKTLVETAIYRVSKTQKPTIL
ncbi:MAG: hypothetical protein RMZ69_20090 [Nostoc sp. ChiQUE01a]|nr:hypothetical protein [Nostoc sp. ChiQUE01a]